MRYVALLFAAAGLAGLVLLASRSTEPAEANHQLVRISPASSSVSPASGNLTLDVRVDNIHNTTNPCHGGTGGNGPCGLGGYTVEMTFDPTVLSFVSFQDGTFLTSTGRDYFSCPTPTINHNPALGVISYSCTTLGSTPLGPEGSGLLSKVTFLPIGVGNTTIHLQNLFLTEANPVSTPICAPTYTPCNAQDGSVQVNYQANMSVSKSAPGSMAAPGNLSYDLTISNLGPEQAGSVSVVDTLPAGVGFVSAGAGCTYSAGPHTVTCDLGTMINGQVQNRNITVSVPATQAGASLLNTATVSTTSVDPTPGNNTSQATTNVSASDLAITKAAPRDVDLGAAGQYTITVTSNGPSIAAAVTVADTLPLFTAYTGHTTTLGSCSETAGIITCNLGDMAPTATATITVFVLFPNSTDPLLPHPDPAVPAGTYVGNSATATWTKVPAGNKTSGFKWTYVGLPDTDGDGCHDYQELGSNPDKGGLRDPLNPYDFYDVPTPAIHNVGPAAAKDFGISGFDLNALLFYGGVNNNGPPNANGADYDDDLNLNGIEDGAEYDYVGLGGFAPDGGVSGLDLSKIIAQGGDSCVFPF